jgi:hypothetical protein
LTLAYFGITLEKGIVWDSSSCLFVLGLLLWYN